MGTALITVLAGVATIAASRPATAAPPGPWTVFSLGDSYSSGEANPPYDPLTYTSTDQCHRSARAWPHLLTPLSRGQVKLVGHVACSGALIANLTSLTSGRDTERAQLGTYALVPAPDVAVVTLGGNELHFASLLGQCVLVNCSSSPLMLKAQALIADQGPNGLTARLAAAYEQIRAVHPTTRLIVVGYPNLVPRAYPAVTCRWLKDNERITMNRLAQNLDAVTSRAATLAGARYVTTLNVLAGHELCNHDPWIYPVGNFFHLSAGGHPTALGQRAMAIAVLPAITGKPVSLGSSSSTSRSTARTSGAGTNGSSTSARTRSTAGAGSTSRGSGSTSGTSAGASSRRAASASAAEDERDDEVADDADRREDVERGEHWRRRQRERGDKCP
jgi:lysophospholipase L1-like esterase